MSKRWMLVLVLSLAGLGSAAEKLVAEWDFTHGISACKYSGWVRGNARTGSAGLENKDLEKDLAGGFATNEIHPELAPSEGFRLEIEFITRGTGQKTAQGLFDNQWVNYRHPSNDPKFNRGLMCYLEWNASRKEYLPAVSLGFADHSRVLRGKPFQHVPGKVRRLVFTFNGIDEAVLSLDGSIDGCWKIEEGRGIASARLVTAIGDRVGGSYWPFDGGIRRVRLFSFPKPDRSVVLALPGRHAFVRNEEKAVLKVKITNNLSTPIREVFLYGTVGDIKFPSRTVSLPASQSVLVPLQMETRMKTGKYPARIMAGYEIDGAYRQKKIETELMIGPVPGDFFPITIWWLWAENLEKYGFRKFQELGFNSGLDYQMASQFVRDKAMGKRRAENRYALLDQMLYHGFTLVDCPALDFYGRSRFPRVGRDGRPYEGAQSDAADPRMTVWAKDGLDSASRAYGEYPAYGGFLVESEIRDASRPSFGRHNAEQYEKATGRKIPAEIRSRLAAHYSDNPSFPLSRIIAEDDPILTYYRWFWRSGDGWNDMNSLAADGIRKHMKHPVWTMFAPAVRVPPLWGSGGKVDYLCHWTYANPDPVAIGANTEELFAMARGRSGQRVMNMTQIICYRSICAPKGKKVANEPSWVAGCPKADYVTLAPDLMKIAVWTQISRKISGMSFYGLRSLLEFEPPEGSHGSQCTNPETARVLADLLHRVVQPLAPVLKRIPERKPEIAVLESFASAIFAHRGSWGYSGWIFDANLMLQYANMQPGVVYEEELLRDGFGRLKVLVMPHCEVLTEPVLAAVSRFQKKGGLLVGDSQLVPGLTPDIQIEELKRSGRPDRDTAAMQKAGLDLRRRLKNYLKPYVSVSSPDIVTHVRSDRDADYLFAVNDRRTFGDYFGPYGLVQEKGLKNAGKITVNRPAGAVYDIVAHRPVPSRQVDGTTVIPVEFAPAEGKILLLQPHPIAGVEVRAQRDESDRQAFSFKVSVYDSTGRKIRTLLPLEIQITSPDGQRTDDSRPAALADGRYMQKVIAPLNVSAGRWQISVRELASGKIGRAELDLR